MPSPGTTRPAPPDRPPHEHLTQSRATAPMPQSRTADHAGAAARAASLTRQLSYPRCSLSAYELTCRDRYGKTCRAVQPERQPLTGSAASVARVAPVRSGNGQGRLSQVPGHRDLLRSAPDVQVRSCTPVVAGVDHGTRTAISACLPVPGNAGGPVRRHAVLHGVAPPQMPQPMNIAMNRTVRPNSRRDPGWREMAAASGSV